jgi:sulfoxide reductase heme-binding subunit YedZ
MSPQTIAAVGHGSTALWYLTRSTGLVSLILLSTTVVLGIVASVGWTTERWPRFLSQSIHRNLSMLCLILIAVHIVTTVADGYVPIGLIDAVVPFRSPYRPLWIGLGALAFDLLVAVAITSALRKRIGMRAWRAVHWLAYLCWPIAVFHGLGSGTDTRLSVALMIEALCVAAVVAAVGWRLASGSALSPRRRVGAGIASVAVVIGIGGFALIGPLRPGWARRAGTSAQLLTQLSTSTAASSTAGANRGSSSTGTSGATSTTSPSSSAAVLPTPPFSADVSGSYQTSPANSAGQIDVVLTMNVHGTVTAPLVVQLLGTAVNGGVAMSSSRVEWGPDSGVVTSLSGSTIGATLNGSSGPIGLTMSLDLNRTNESIVGTVSVTSPAAGDNGTTHVNSDGGNR